MGRIARHVVGVLFLGFLFACGGGGGGNNSSNSTTGGGLGPSGKTCTNTGACFTGGPTLSCSCSVTSGPNTALVATDYDYVLDSLNAIRMNLGLGLFARTAALDTFAQNASNQLLIDNVPHGYFQNAISMNGGSCPPEFTGGCAENQGAPTGWTTNLTTTQIDEIMACFMSEETAPAGCATGHWEAIVCPCFAKIGVGLAKDAAGQLFLTIDFSE